MDKDLAVILANSSIYVTRELGSLIQILPSDFKDEREEIAQIIDRVQSRIMKKAFDEYPEIEEDLERRIKKYGKAI